MKAAFDVYSKPRSQAQQAQIEAQVRHHEMMIKNFMADLYGEKDTEDDSSDSDKKTKKQLLSV